MGVTVLAVLAALHVVTCLSLSQFTDMPRVSLSTTSTWTKANTSCRLYQPEIYFNGSGAFVDIKSSIINRTQPWVGYVRAFTAFDYIGCWSELTMMHDTNRIFNASSIDMCFSYCLLHNNTVFGIQKFYTAGLLTCYTCYCLNRIPKASETWTSHCRVCGGLPCGRYGAYTSIYQLGTLQKDGIDGTVCLAIAKGNKYTWEQCHNTTVSGIVCKERTSSGETFAFVNSSVNSWVRLMTFCKRSFTETVEATDINALPLSANELYWTDTFGTMVIRRGTDMNLRHPVTFGYYNEGKISFKRDTEDTNALCGIYMPRVSLSTTSTWTKANTSCRLYRPEIYFNGSGAFIDINSSIINRTQPWVGYVRAFTAFDYLGCWSYVTLIRDTNRTFNASSIDMCFSYCLLHNITLLGVKKFYKSGILTCYCLNRIESGAATWSTYCNRKCSGLPCGRGGRDVTSVYQLAPLQTDGIDGTVCLAIEKSNKYTWEQCDNTTVSGIVCRRMIYTGDEFKFVNISVSNWAWQVTFCKTFLETVYATDINALPLSANELYWTNTIGTMVIRRGTDMNLRHPVTFGYYNEGKISFKGDTEDTNALCEIIPTTASIPTTETDVPTTASIPTTETDGLWIGLGVGLPMVLGGCLAGIVIYLKCRRLSTATSKGTAQTLVVANTEYDAPLPQEQTIENISTSYAGNNYFVLGKTKYCAALPNAQTCHASLQMAESVYDVSGERALHKMPTENVYNTTTSFPLQESVNNHTSTSSAESEAFRTSTNPVTEIVEQVYGPKSATGQKGYFETENVYKVSNHKDNRGGEYDQTNAFLLMETTV